MNIACVNSFRDYDPSFADLPIEILLHIFKYLNYTDTKIAASCCRRWFEISQAPRIQANVIIKFCQTNLGDNSEPILTFLKTKRSFYNIHFEQSDLGCISKFMTQIGDSVQKIIFENIDLNEKQFRDIIKKVGHLNELIINNCSALFMAGQFLESNNDKKSLSDVFKNITTLSLKNNRYLSDAILSRLTSTIPHIYSLDLSGCQLAYHSSLQRRFYPGENEKRPSESILTFQFVMKIIEAHVSTLQELNLSRTLIGGPALTALSEFKNWTLKKLVLNSCIQLTQAALVSFFMQQKEILHLDLSSSRLVTDSVVCTIAEQLSHLEVLNLSNCKNITNSSVMILSNLKNLKALDLSYCTLITSDGISNGIAKTANNVLHELRLLAIDLCQDCIIKCSNNLRNLRIFDVGSSVNGVTDVAVQSIITNMIWLRYLNLEFCSNITDSAIIGIDLTKDDENINRSTTMQISKNNNQGNYPRISLRSKAEEKIIDDAERKKIMTAICEKDLNYSNIKNTFSIQNLNGLRYLNLSGCNRISDVSLKYGIKFNELKILILSNCQQISFSGMLSLVQNCPSIEELHLEHCHNLDDKTIEIITIKLCRLQFLNINGCTQLTDHSLDYIAVNCKILKKLSIRGCRGMCSEPHMRLTCLTSLHIIYMDNAPSFENDNASRIKLHPPPLR